VPAGGSGGAGGGESGGGGGGGGKGVAAAQQSYTSRLLLLLLAVRLAGVEGARGVLEDEVAVGGGDGVRAERARRALLLPREVERGGAWCRKASGFAALAKAGAAPQPPRSPP
jgi:hypothetical protein